DVLMEMSGLSAEQVDEIVEQAEMRAHDAEEAAAEERRIRRDRDRQQQEQPSPTTDGDQAGAEAAEELQPAAVQPQDDAAEPVDASTEPAGEAGGEPLAAGAGEGAESEVAEDPAETTGSTPKSP